MKHKTNKGKPIGFEKIRGLKGLKKSYSGSSLSHARTTHHSSTCIFDPMEDLKFNGRTLWMIRSYTNTDYSEKVILSKSIFNFVDSWLLKQSNDDIFKKSLYYWRQAKDYYIVGVDTKSEVKPLLNYYCCLNMVKCFLCLKGVSMKDLRHGVGCKTSSKVDLDNQMVYFYASGALKELRNLLKAPKTEANYSLKTLLYNLACIHRAYCYTFPNDPEIFIPLKWLKYKITSNKDKITVAFKTVKPVDLHTTYLIPSLFEFTTDTESDWNQIKGLSKPERLTWGIKYNKLVFKSKKVESWKESNKDENKKMILSNYHQKIRPYFQYISSEAPLWYLRKKDDNNKKILGEPSLVISFAAMHCLSEMVRYQPELYSNLLKSEYGWLLTEFIEVGMDQFVDEIASEITGLNIMMSGIRGKR